MKMILLSLAFFSASCAQKIWVKPGGTDVEFQRDLAEARYHSEAATVGTFNSYSSPFMNSSQRMGESAANGVVRAIEQQKLLRMYLEMKGWRLETVEPEKKNSASPVMHQSAPSGETLYLEEGPNEEVGG